jgi:hypothetical protein
MTREFIVSTREFCFYKILAIHKVCPSILFYERLTKDKIRIHIDEYLYTFDNLYKNMRSLEKLLIQNQKLGKMTDPQVYNTFLLLKQNYDDISTKTFLLTQKLQEYGVIHGELTNENIVIYPNNECRLINFYKSYFEDFEQPPKIKRSPIIID